MNHITSKIEDFFLLRAKRSPNLVSFLSICRLLSLSAGH